MAKVSARLLKARVLLSLSDPYLATALMRLPIVPDTTGTIGTAATDGCRILYSEKFVASCSNPELRGLLSHELMHVLTDSVGRRVGRDPTLWNIACDYAINQILADLGFRLPKAGLLDSRFKGMTSEQIYDALSKGKDKKGKGDALGKQKGWRSVSESGSGSGEGSDRDSTEHGEVPGDLRRDLIPPEDPIVKKISREGLPEDAEARRLEIGQMRADFAERAKAAGKLAGSLATELQLASEPRVDWRGLLQQWMTDRVRTDWSTWPPAKKAIWRGLYLPSVGVPAPCRLVMAIDTSGSMSDEALARIFAEVRSFRDTFPTPFTIVQSDVAVRSVLECEAYDDFDEGAVRVAGRGGTDFRPLYKWVEEHCVGEAVAVIHATDGEGDWPDAVRFPVVFLVPREADRDGKQFPDWGDRISV